MKRARAIDAEAPPEAKCARVEEGVPEPQLLHDIWKPVIEALHISDQAMMLAVSRECRALAIDAIIAAMSRVTRLDAGRRSLNPLYFERNGRIHVMSWRISYRKGIVLSFTTMEPASLGCSYVAEHAYLRWTIVPLDAAIYRCCIACCLLGRNTGITLTPDAWLCSEKCMATIVDGLMREPQRRWMRRSRSRSPSPMRVNDFATIYE